MSRGPLALFVQCSPPTPTQFLLTRLVQKEPVKSAGIAGQFRFWREWTNA